MVVLKQSLGNHLRAGWLAIAFIIFYLLIWFQYQSSEHSEKLLDGYSLFLLLFCFGIMLLPAVYLHIEYSMANFGQKITLGRNVLIVQKSQSERKIFVADISEMVLFKAANADTFPILPMQRYSFVRVISKTGEIVTITNLMSKDLEFLFSKIGDVKCQRVKSFFPTIFSKI